MRLSSTYARIVFISTFWTAPLLCQYPQMYFPLHVGDQWQFVEAPSFFHDAKVLGTVTINGHMYASMSGLLTEGYYRMDGTKLYQYSGGDKLVCDFSAKFHDTLAIQSNGYDSVFVQLYDQGFTQAFGQTRFQMTFFHRSLRSPGIIRATYRVLDSIGFQGVSKETIFLVLGGAIIDGKQSGVITSVADLRPETPSEIRLSQNYPNPFNPSTSISYSLPKTAVVSLRIFNALGQEITTLVNERKEAGNYQVTWNATVPSGIYFYRLQAGEFIETKKAILLK